MIHTGTSSRDTQTNAHECPVCHGTGWEEFEKEGYVFCRECSCGIRQKARNENRLKFANIPHAFKNHRLSNFSELAYKTVESRNKALAAMRQVNYWLDNLNGLNGQIKGLYLYSRTPGSGKTRMAASVANELLERGRHVKFATSKKIMDEIKATWNDRERTETENEILTTLGNVDVLVIDDLDVENGSQPWINERFYSLINERYINNHITIFTSNKSIDNLRYDERVKDRITAMTYPIVFPEESVRRKEADEDTRDMIKSVFAHA